MAEFLEKYYYDKIIWTNFPLEFFLTEPIQGYVKKPLINIKHCSNYKEGEKVNLIVAHPLDAQETKCLMLAKKINASPLIVFEKKWDENINI